MQRRENTDTEDRAIWDIVPLEHGQVFIFFPAEKETSKLHFHLHAPFASPADRSSVVDCADNEKLRDELSKLVAESFLKIREKGMLNINFLEVLPVPADKLTPFYECIRKTIVDAFQRYELVPTKSNNHDKATELYRGEPQITDLFSAKDLSLLLDREIHDWVATAHEEGKNKFLDSISIEKIGKKDLEKLLFPYPDRKGIIEDLIKSKDDEWIYKFYTLLGEVHNQYHYKFTGAQLYHIVRVKTESDNETCLHVLPKDAYFPPLQNGADISNINDIDIDKETCFVNSIYWSRPEVKNEYAKIFLELIGVKTLHERTIIEMKLKKYETNLMQYNPLHINDIIIFITFWQKTRDISLFSQAKFILCIDNNNREFFCEPKQSFIDDPYKHTGLSVIKHIHKRYAVSSIYKEQLNEPQLEDFIKFIELLGVMKGLKIVQVSSIDNEIMSKEIEKIKQQTKIVSKTKEEIDYSIEFLKEYIKMQSLVVSKMIWNTLINLDKYDANTYSWAKFVANSKSAPVITKSTLLDILSSYA